VNTDLFGTPTLIGLKVKLDRPVDRERPCCRNICLDNPFLADPPLPHERLRIAVTARRIAAVKLGYEPIPIVSGRKKPAMNGWTDVHITIPPDEDIITPWTDTYPNALSTGIRTRFTPGIDIDIRDAKVADLIQAALIELLPQGTILTRVGQPPKRLIPCRCTTPFNKIGTTFKSPDGVAHKVEILCGQERNTERPSHPWR
jgi:hypothetical protein